ncbi:hypothetical protein V2J09_018287 [Rumex salicifolius]
MFIYGLPEYSLSVEYRTLIDRKVIERLLKISSCKVTAVETAKRALQYLGLLDEERSSNGFDRLEVNLIITDYSMPGMTGYELMKKIKESSTLKEIPVVIMSSENILARDFEVFLCLEDGAKDYIVKPVKLAHVRRLKDSMINGSCGAEIKETVSTKGPISDLNSILPLVSITNPPLVPSSSAAASITKLPSVPTLASESPVNKEYKCDSQRRVLRLYRYDYRK